MARILLVEDDEALAAVICRELAAGQYDVRHVSTGPDALDAVGQFSPDAMILDWMLPGLDGLEVLRTVRKGSCLPILMLTARRDEVDRIVGLEVGADDYLTKPFSMRELLARIRALLRRVERTRELLEADSRQEKPLFYKGLSLDPRTFVAQINEAALDLTPIEFKLLYLLMAKPGRTFTRRYLMSTLWEQDYFEGDRSVDNAVLRLRRKLGAYGENIQTQRGLGYRFIDA